MTRLRRNIVPLAAALAGALLGAFLASELAALHTQRGALDDASRLLARQLGSQPTPARGRAELPALPDGTALGRISADLPALAKDEGLTLVDVSFSPAPSGADGVHSVLIAVRLKGGYAHIKSLLRHLLDGHETLALMSLSLRRPSATETMLEGEVQLAFYFEARP